MAQDTQSTKSHPAGLGDYIRLMRFDRPIGIWLLLWPCWWSTALAAHAQGAAYPDPWLLVLFLIGSAAMRAAGCIYNDIIDRDVDGRVARTKNRPIAAGLISVPAAVALMLGLCLVGLGVLVQFNGFAIALGFGSIALVAIYPFMKRITNWPQAVLGLAFSWGALMGWAATFGALDWPAIALYAAAVAWTIGYDTIYAHQDKDDDALIGLGSTALKFGAATPSWLMGFYGATVLLLLAAGLMVGAGVIFATLMAMAALQLAWQIGSLNINDSDNCLARFRSNRVFGLLVFLALALDLIVQRAITN